MGVRCYSPSLIVGDDRPAQAAFKFVTSDTIDRVNGTGAPEEDFRWIINLEGGLFHGDPLNCSAFNTHNVIELTGGEYYFYTALRSAPGIKFTRRGGLKNPLEFRRIGAVIGARVYLEERLSQAVVMRWNNGFEEEEQVVTLSKQDSGGSHEIYIENTPLHEVPTLPPTTTHSELIEYYKVITGIDDNAKFNLVPDHDTSVSDGDKGTPDIPCQSVVLDGV